MDDKTKILLEVDIPTSEPVKNITELKKAVAALRDEQKQLKEAGVPAELIRISLGLEDKEDLIADIAAALDAIK